MLFIPITTLSLSTLKGQQIGQGAAFTGMMRQLGGSFGVATITTFLAGQNMQHRSDLVSRLDMNNTNVQQRIMAMQHNFTNKGIPAGHALQSSYKSLDYIVTSKLQFYLIWMPFYTWALCFLYVFHCINGKRKQEMQSKHV